MRHHTEPLTPATIKVGDVLMHRKTGQRLTIKALGNGSSILCAYVGGNYHNQPTEYQALVEREDLRELTQDEKETQA